MSKRTDFTSALGQLIVWANEQGISVIGDWMKRDEQTQRRMFEAGLSKCDGVKKRSRHQYGLAVDMFVVEGGKLVSRGDHPSYALLHDKWDELGGGVRIAWDMGHFEF